MRLLLLSRLNCATAQLSYNATIAVVAVVATAAAAATAAVVVATARLASSALAALVTAVVAVGFAVAFAFAVDDDDGTTTRLASFGRNLKTQD